MSNANAIISDSKGVYARVARNLNVSASMVGRVACVERRSLEIERALFDELNVLKQNRHHHRFRSQPPKKFPPYPAKSPLRQQIRKISLAVRSAATSEIHHANLSSWGALVDAPVNPD